MKEAWVKYNDKICPCCGGPMKHPYTGLVTMEQLEEDSNSCIIMEVVGEGDFTIGYKVICHKGEEEC